MFDVSLPGGQYYIGVPDRVLCWRGNSNFIGYVGFWELDGPFPLNYRQTLAPLNRDVSVFATERGAHLVAFDVTDLSGKMQFREACMKLGGDYPLFRENTLRISAKNGIKPKYLFTIKSDTAKTYGVSSFHLRAYRPLFGPYYPIVRPRMVTIRTEAHLYFYNSDPSGVIETARLGEKA